VRLQKDGRATISNSLWIKSKKNEEMKQNEKKQEQEDIEDITNSSASSDPMGLGSEQAKKLIEELEDQAKEFEDKWKRALADYQNQEKWMHEQRSEWIKTANKDLLLRILPILDTLVLAQQHSQEQALKVSVDQFLTILKDVGAARIETVGKEFNPYLMEAITTEDGEENKVITEIRAGYTLYDKILRPAQVTVGKGKS
jgi:molecular chaperone GrpE